MNRYDYFLSFDVKIELQNSWQLSCLSNQIFNWEETHCEVLRTAGAAFEESVEALRGTILVDQVRLFYL